MTVDLDAVVLEPYPRPPTPVGPEPHRAALDVAVVEHPQEVDGELGQDPLVTGHLPFGGQRVRRSDRLRMPSVVGIGAAIVATTPSTVRSRIDILRSAYGSARP